MGIPTGGPSQDNPLGRNRSGLPTRDSSGQPNRQIQRRTTGLPADRQQRTQQPSRAQQPQQPQQPTRRPQRTANPAQGNSGANRQQPPSQRPTQGGSRVQPSSQQRSTPRAQPQRRPAPQPQEELPLAPDQDFEDPFDFNPNGEDPFAEVPSGYDDSEELDDFGADDPFESMDDDFVEEDLIAEEEIEEPAPAPSRAKPKPVATPTRISGNNGGPRRKAHEEEYSEDFTDRENLKLKPFGGKRKSKVKVGDFDNRKNLQSQRKLYRGIFIAGVLAVVGFGAYQTFVPPETLSVAEVENIASYMSGETGFPTTRGEGFALNFADTLLNYDAESESAAKRSAALAYFYGFSGQETAIDDAISVVGDVKQNVVYGPVIFDSTPLTATSASYNVGVLISTVDPKQELDAANSEEIASTMRWVNFNVNVYYNETNDSLAIAEGSPSLLPPEEVLKADAVPAAEPLGEKLDEYPQTIEATVYGFLEGYRKSTKENFQDISQYIGSNADETLRSGLGSRYQFSNPDSPQDSIVFEVYSRDEAANELKIDATVDWIIPAGGESSVVIPSRYVITLERVNGDDYTVTKFAPYYWTEAVEETE